MKFRLFFVSTVIVAISLVGLVAAVYFRQREQRRQERVVVKAEDVKTTLIEGWTEKDR